MKKYLFALSSTAIFCSCEEQKATKSGATGAKIEATPSASASPSATNTTPAAAEGEIFYAGFDGSNDYSILLPATRDYTLTDSTIATIKKETVNLSEATINELVAQVKESTPTLDANMEAGLRRMFTRQQSATRITPLKSGKTTLTSSRGNRGGRDRWGNNTIGITLIVNPYTPAQFEAGKARYNNDGGGALKACKSCHETGAEGAPPHELGHIRELSDEESLKWLTTGTLKNSTAKIPHAWEFNNAEEKAGIVPFLRAKSSKDIEAFTKLIFEERFQEFKNSGGMAPPPPPGP